MGVDRERMERRWAALAQDAFTGMAEWRAQHPTATFREIEAAVDERLAAVRASMLQDAALASAATELEGSVCPACGQPLHNGGTRSRRLLTNYNKEVRLDRRYGVCPSPLRGHGCGGGLFPPG